MSAAPAAPLNQSYHPTTFVERGVLVPFTTPMLAGTRARPGDRGGPELIVPSRAGGRGAYVLPWGSVQELCRPTVHDRVLNDKVTALDHVTPATLRRAAREVARQGLAGREAQAAAETAAEIEDKDQLLANFLLLLAVIQQIEPSEASEFNLGSQTSAEIEARARRATTRVAPQLGQAPDAIAQSLEELAGLFAIIGVGAQRESARVPRVLRHLQRLQDETSVWAGQFEDDSGEQAQLIANVAEFTATCARSTLDKAYKLLEDPVGLLRRWRVARQAVIHLAGRPDWLLDGWEQICLIWDYAKDHDAKTAALEEIALLVPVVPREISDWLGLNLKEKIAGLRRTIVLNEDWRTGAQVFDLVPRNEHLRALAP